MRGIIIEGADGNGKSFLCRQLSRTLNIDLKTCGKPPETLSEYDVWLHSQRSQLRREDVILDRHTPISCYAYYELNGAPVSEATLVTHMIVSNMKCNPIYVLCRTSKPKIDPNKPYKSNKYLYNVKLQSEVINMRYDQIFKVLNVEPIVYDWRTDSYDELLQRILTCTTNTQAINF